VLPVAFDGWLPFGAGGSGGGGFGGAAVTIGGHSPL
jgi:hypothetical protein